MKITESRLRKLIRSVIKEARAEEDEALLGIGAPLIDTFPAYPYTYDKPLTDESIEKILQLFKAWCIKNDIAGEHPSRVIKLFFADYPEISNAIDDDESAREDMPGPLRGYESVMSKLHRHARICSKRDF